MWFLSPDHSGSKRPQSRRLDEVKTRWQRMACRPPPSLHATGFMQVLPQHIVRSAAFLPARPLLFAERLQLLLKPVPHPASSRAPTGEKGVKMGKPFKIHQAD